MTCLTSLVPIPQASEPKAPVLVWLSVADNGHARLGQAQLGPIMWTMPWLRQPFDAALALAQPLRMV